MKVYIVFGQETYESPYVVAVYLDKNTAEKKVAELEEKEKYRLANKIDTYYAAYNYYVEDHEVIE